MGGKRRMRRGMVYRGRGNNLIRTSQDDLKLFSVRIRNASPTGRAAPEWPQGHATSSACRGNSTTYNLENTLWQM